MTRKQILIAGAALLIAATAYAQTRDQGSHGDRGNAGAFGQGNGQGGFGQGGDPNTLQGSPPNFGEDDQDTYQSIWPGKAPNEAATRQRGDRDLHSRPSPLAPKTAGKPARETAGPSAIGPSTARGKTARATIR